MCVIIRCFTVLKYCYKITVIPLVLAWFGVGITFFVFVFKQKKGIVADSFLIVWLWRWRDSNSRPNEELICFLHVYLRLHCREQARPKPPTWTLSSKTSSFARGMRQTISDISAPPYRIASKPQHPGDVPFPQLLQELSSNLLFFD